MFQTLFGEPIYNLFIFFTEIEWINAGIAIILTTLVIKIILFPLQKSQIKTQIATKKAEPELKKIKEEFSNVTDPVKKQQMGMKMMEVYKKHKLNPFAPILILIIQIPILLALFWTFMVKDENIVDGDNFAVLKDKLYSFIENGLVSDVVSMNFMDINLLETSIVVALLAATTQYLHLHMTMPEVRLSDFKKQEKGMKENFVNSLKVNMKFGLPVFVFVILATYLSSALGLYWITSNIFMIFQEYLVRSEKKKLKGM